MHIYFSLSPFSLSPHITPFYKKKKKKKKTFNIDSFVSFSSFFLFPLFLHPLIVVALFSFIFPLLPLSLPFFISSQEL